MEQSLLNLGKMTRKLLLLLLLLRSCNKVYIVLVTPKGNRFLFGEWLRWLDKYSTKQKPNTLQSYTLTECFVVHNAKCIQCRGVIDVADNRFHNYVRLLQAKINIVNTILASELFAGLREKFFFRFYCRVFVWQRFVHNYIESIKSRAEQLFPKWKTGTETNKWNYFCWKFIAVVSSVSLLLNTKILIVNLCRTIWKLINKEIIGNNE